MSKINIKIVEVDQTSHTVSLKYASENSLKPIDSYPAIAFQVSNFAVNTLEEFIETIRPQISLYVWQRDQAENPATPIDISGWAGYAAEFESFNPVDPALPSQLVPIQVAPEVKI